MSREPEYIYVVQQKWPTEGDDKWRDRPHEEYVSLEAAMRRKSYLEHWYREKAFMHSDPLAFVFRVGKKQVVILPGVVKGGAL